MHLIVLRSNLLWLQSLSSNPQENKYDLWQPEVKVYWSGGREERWKEVADEERLLSTSSGATCEGLFPPTLYASTYSGSFVTCEGLFLHVLLLFFLLLLIIFSSWIIFPNLSLLPFHSTSLSPTIKKVFGNFYPGTSRQVGLVKKLKLYWIKSSSRRKRFKLCPIGHLRSCFLFKLSAIDFLVLLSLLNISNIKIGDR